MLLPTSCSLSYASPMASQILHALLIIVVLFAGIAGGAYNPSRALSLEFNLSFSAPVRC